MLHHLGQAASYSCQLGFIAGKNPLHVSTLFSSLKRIVFVGGEQIHSPKISGKKGSRMWQSQWLCSEPAGCHLGLGQMLRIWACLKSRALPACCRPETTRGELCAAPHLLRGGTHQRSRRKGFQNIHQLDHGVRIHSLWMWDLHLFPLPVVWLHKIWSHPQHLAVAVHIFQFHLQSGFRAGNAPFWLPGARQGQGHFSTFM